MRLHITEHYLAKGDQILDLPLLHRDNLTTLFIQYVGLSSGQVLKPKYETEQRSDVIRLLLSFTRHPLDAQDLSKVSQIFDAHLLTGLSAYLKRIQTCDVVSEDGKATSINLTTNKITNVPRNGFRDHCNTFVRTDNESFTNT